MESGGGCFVGWGGWTFELRRRRGDLISGGGGEEICALVREDGRSSEEDGVEELRAFADHICIN
nr:hypothetical protein Iba_scaffold58145CG0010 [Ipomoea batatas]GMD12788.1 hypothetical protein Iba_chr07aCG6850 [Ipomoea batatas]